MNRGEITLKRCVVPVVPSVDKPRVFPSKGWTEGTKGVHDKCRWSLPHPPAAHTAPQRGSGKIPGWSVSRLLAVAGGRKQKVQRENRMVPEVRKVDLAGGFRAIWQGSTREHFSPPGINSGAVSSLRLRPPQLHRNPGGGCAKIDTQKTKIGKSCGRTENVSVLITLPRPDGFPGHSMVLCVAAKEAAQCTTT